MCERGIILPLTNIKKGQLTKEFNMYPWEIQQTLEDTHVARKTPSDKLDPVRWDATIGEAVRAGCEAFNALGIEGPPLECDD